VNPSLLLILIFRQRPLRVCGFPVRFAVTAGRRVNRVVFTIQNQIFFRKIEISPDYDAQRLPFFEDPVESQVDPMCDSVSVIESQLFVSYHFGQKNDRDGRVFYTSFSFDVYKSLFDVFHWFIPVNVKVLISLSGVVCFAVSIAGGCTYPTDNPTTPINRIVRTPLFCSPQR
jgi:hypothetical protein